MAQFAAAGKTQPKKSLAEIAMQYGYVYVAQVAMGANPNQTLKAITEAEAYHGPSLVIGYAPCEMHSIKGGMANCQMEMKKAVECGYWNLFRFNPALKAEGKNPFTLDSKAPAGGYQEFLMNEARYSSLTRAFPERAKELFAENEEAAKARYEHLLYGGLFGGPATGGAALCAVRAFCRRQNLGAGAIYCTAVDSSAVLRMWRTPCGCLPRACEIKSGPPAGPGPLGNGRKGPLRAPLTGTHPQSSGAAGDGRGGTAEGMSFRAGAEANDLQLVPTRWSCTSNQDRTRAPGKMSGARFYGGLFRGPAAGGALLPAGAEIPRRKTAKFPVTTGCGRVIMETELRQRGRSPWSVRSGRNTGTAWRRCWPRRRWRG